MSSIDSFMIFLLIKSGIEYKYPSATAHLNVDNGGEPNTLYKNFSLSIDVNCYRLVCRCDCFNRRFVKSITYIPVVRHR